MNRIVNSVQGFLGRGNNSKVRATAGPNYNAINITTNGSGESTDLSGLTGLLTSILEVLTNISSTNSTIANNTTELKDTGIKMDVNNNVDSSSKKETAQTNETPNNIFLGSNNNTSSSESNIDIKVKKIAMGDLT